MSTISLVVSSARNRQGWATLHPASASSDAPNELAASEMIRTRRIAPLLPASSSPTGVAHDREHDSEPIVGDASTVLRQVISGVEPVVTDNGNLRNTLQVGQPQVDPHGALPILAVRQTSPVRHAAADGAEMKHDPLSVRVGLSRARDLDTIPFIIIGPQRGVTVTRGAIAHGS